MRRVNPAAAARPIRTPRTARRGGLAENNFQHVTALRAQRHANADFVRALADDVGNHAINSDAGKQQRERGEHREQNHGEAPRGERLRNNVVHGVGVEQNGFAVEVVDGLANGAGESVGRAFGAHDVAGESSKRFDKQIGKLQRGSVKLRRSTGELAFSSRPNCLACPTTPTIWSCL